MTAVTDGRGLGAYHGAMANAALTFASRFIPKDAGRARQAPDVSKRRFLRDRSGVTAIEYAFIAAGIGAMIALSLGTIGKATTASFNAAAQGFLGAGTGSGDAGAPPAGDDGGNGEPETD